jgi:hypothetical protein
MIRKIMQYWGMVHDRVLIRTKPMGSMNQIRWGMEIAQDIFGAGEQKKLRHKHLIRPVERYPRNGEVLWNRLPAPIGSLVIRRSFDPYDKDMTTGEIRDWLFNHIIFDGAGGMVGLYDEGQILFAQEGWQCEVDWFYRVKMHHA